MDQPLDDIEFLSRSEHRVEVLVALAERPHSRADLRSLTGASSSTVGRLLSAFEARCWIRRVDHRYEATSLGAFVAEGVVALIERMRTEHELRGVTQWFPAGRLPFDVRCLSDAAVVVPTESNPTAPIRRSRRQLRGGNRLRFLTTQATVSYFDSLREAVTSDGMTVEGVVTPDVHDRLVNETALEAVYRPVSASASTKFYVAETVPIIVQIVDDSVGIGLVDTPNVPRALILCEDETVHGWAVETFETCRDGAERVDVPERERSASDPPAG